MYITGQDSPNYIATPPEHKTNPETQCFLVHSDRINCQKYIKHFFQSTLLAEITTLVFQYKKVIKNTFKVNNSSLEKYI